MSNIKKFLFSSIAVILLMILIFSSSVNAMSRFYPNSKSKGISWQNLMKNFNFNRGIDNNISNSTSPEEHLKEVFGWMEDYNYDFSDFEYDISLMQANGTGNVSDIQGKIGKLPEGFSRDVLNKLLGKFSNINIKSLLSKITNMVDLLGKLGDLGFDIGGNSSANLPEAKDVYVDGVSASLVTGEVVQLHGKLYLNEGSNKWAVLIHPFAFTGESIAPKIGPAYYELGYNLLAIDLRGFGDSGGKMAMGFLDGLDVYDWLEKINKEYKPETIFIHGISLGGGTTNFASGVDQFMEQAPENIRVNKDFKSLEELHVEGLVADSAFVEMTAIGAGELMLTNILTTGLTKENIDYYSNATNSLKHCKLPILLIHGTSDTTVKFDQAQKAQAAIATPDKDVHTYYVEGGAHAFIVMGNNKDEYKTRVQNFVTQYEK